MILPPPEQRAAWPRVDVILLSYGHRRWIAPCLEALMASGYPADRLSLVLLDNGSTDGSEQEFLAWKARLAAEAPATLCRVVQNGANLGFSGGNNVGWRLGTAPYVLFLNLDTEVRPGFLQAMIEGIARHPRAAFAGCKIYFPDSRRLQHAGGLVYLNGMTDHYANSEEDRGQADVEREVDYVTGACMLARRDRLTALGGFDEAFNPAYYEEVDLCLRAAYAGWSTVYVPAALITHHESAGLGGRRDPRFLRAIYRGRMRLVARHWTPAAMIESWWPTERWWFGIVESREARPFVRRSYWQAAWDVARSNLRALAPWRALPPLPPDRPTEGAAAPGPIDGRRLLPDVTNG